MGQDLILRSLSKGISFICFLCTCVLLVFRAVQENVIAVIGPSSSTTVHATNPVCSGLHLPQLAPVATDPTLVQYEYPFLVRVCYICSGFRFP